MKTWLSLLISFLLLSPLAFADVDGQPAQAGLSKSCYQSITRAAFAQVTKSVELHEGSTVRLAFFGGMIRSSRISRHKNEIVATFEISNAQDKAPTLQNVIVQFVSKANPLVAKSCTVVNAALLKE